VDHLIAGQQVAQVAGGSNVPCASESPS